MENSVKTNTLKSYNSRERAVLNGARLVHREEYSYDLHSEIITNFLSAWEAYSAQWHTVT